MPENQLAVVSGSSREPGSRTGSRASQPRLGAGPARARDLFHRKRDSHAVPSLANAAARHSTTFLVGVRGLARYPPSCRLALYCSLAQPSERCNRTAARARGRCDRGCSNCLTDSVQLRLIQQGHAVDTSEVSVSARCLTGRQLQRLLDCREPTDSARVSTILPARPRAEYSTDREPAHKPGRACAEPEHRE
jgi:hypothetical protein